MGSPDPGRAPRVSTLAASRLLLRGGSTGYRTMATSGRPVSGYNVPNDPASATRRLIQTANAVGYSVRLVDRLPLYRMPSGWPVYGETDSGTKVIVVSTERGPERTVITLALGEPLRKSLWIMRVPCS